MVSGPLRFPLRGPLVYLPTPLAARRASTVVPPDSAAIISSRSPCSIEMTTLRLRTRLPPRGGLLVGILGFATGAGSIVVVRPADRSSFAFSTSSLC